MLPCFSWSPDKPARKWPQVVKGSAVVTLIHRKEEKRIGSFMNMSYTCYDIDKTYDELKKSGVDFASPGHLRDTQGQRRKQVRPSSDWKHTGCMVVPRRRLTLQTAQPAVAP